MPEQAEPSARPEASAPPDLREYFFEDQPSTLEDFGAWFGASKRLDWKDSNSRLEIERASFAIGEFSLTLACVVELREDLSFEEQPVKILAREAKKLRNRDIPYVKVLGATTVSVRPRIGEHPNTELPQHPNADLPLDPFNVEENEEEPAFLPRDPKDLLIDSMRKKLEEKDKDISNLHRKLDEVLEMFSNMQRTWECNYAILKFNEDEFTSALEDNADDGVEEGDSEKEFRQKLERKKKEEQGSTAYAQRATNYRLDSVNEELFNIRVEQKEIAKMVIGLEARIEQVLRLMAPAPRRVRLPQRNNRLQEMMERIERMMAPDTSQEQTTENVSSQDSRMVKDQDLLTRKEKQRLSRKSKNNQVLNPSWHQSTDNQKKDSTVEKRRKPPSIKIDDEKVTEWSRCQDVQVYEGKGKAPLIENQNCFAWSYKEMPGLNPEVAVHKLAIDSQAHPVKQAPRRMTVDLEEQIIAETKKLIEAGFIREEKYANWIASIVPVKKKNGQIRICVDFRDFNKACPKDDFPLPITELMIDNTSSYELFLFMDGSSGYNQIKMAPEDEKHTAFRTPIGIYCYRVMPFGLKNAGATYQRAMTRIFDDLLHKTVECYVDDLVVKRRTKEITSKI
uniref:Reverse transcriptase domain-containing protein n=1 Tax=Ananas comosus var. bracteatus TaxID=296719 RepID=A0A6V7P4W1_ANACO|nr:unnamed protein product [Ananas comosus var. bracteatus]